MNEICSHKRWPYQSCSKEKIKANSNKPIRINTLKKPTGKYIYFAAYIPILNSSIDHLTLVYSLSIFKSNYKITMRNKSDNTFCDNF